MKRRTWLTAILVALIGGTLLAVRVGQAPSTSPDPGSPSPHGVPSADPVGWAGIVWQHVAKPFAAGDPAPLRIDGLVGGDGVVSGWGRVATPGRNQFGDVGAVFLSSDGVSWRSIALDDGVDPKDTSEPSGVAVGPLGMLAYGGVCCSVEERALWQSTDGLMWTRIRPVGAFMPQASFMTRIVGVETGWVAVGSAGVRAAIWTSADGRTWELVDPDAAGLGKGVVSDVAITPDGLVAVGTVDDAAGTHDGAIWVSKDGTTWVRTAENDATLVGPDEVELSRVISFAGGLFVVGNFGAHRERVQCEQLIGAVASLHAEPRRDRENALSCGWGREHHWISPDASAWVRLPPLDPLPGQPPAPGARPIESRLLAAGGPGLVNLSEDSVPPEGDSRIWVSADGRTWKPIDAPYPAPAGSVASAMAIVGRQIVAVGDEGVRPSISIGSVR
jgi:hypothetical protein